MPEKVFIFDTTLRDGEQSPGCSMNLPEKIEMARQLDRLVVAVTVRIHDSYLAGIDSFTFSPDGNRIAYVVEGNLYYQNL